MKILTVSDKECVNINEPQTQQKLKDLDLVISCGDLSYYYLENIICALKIPLYFVRGNHAREMEYGPAGPRTAPHGAIDLHQSVIYDPATGLLIAGVEGSLSYNLRSYQYTQNQMWGFVLQMVPALLINKIRHGRYLDLFVTHAPPSGIHDQPDPAHRGVKAFRWLCETFRPTCHIHGHIHIYDDNILFKTMLGSTLVLNTYGCRQLTLDGAPQYRVKVS